MHAIEAINPDGRLVKLRPRSLTLLCTQRRPWRLLLEGEPRLRSVRITDLSRAERMTLLLGEDCLSDRWLLLLAPGRVPALG